MGAANSREDLDLTSSSGEEEEEDADEEYDPGSASGAKQRQDDPLRATTPASIEFLDAKLRALDLKYKQPDNAARLYLHVGGASADARWVPAERRATYAFLDKAAAVDDDDYYDDERRGRRSSSSASSRGPRWVLEVDPGRRVSAPVGQELQLKALPGQRRADFAAAGSVWALRFPNDAAFRRFREQYDRCLFENTYGVEATDEGRREVFGADFAAWARPAEADDAVWADAEDDLAPPPAAPARDLLEEFEEEAGDGSGIQSLALGALDNSFLVGGAGIQVVKNFRHGVHGKGVSVRISGGRGGGTSTNYSTPKKALLMRGETNMLLMSPGDTGAPHSNGVHHVDIETGKVVAEWRFEKDGTDITMRDIANDSKSAQLEPSGSTFLGLDDNRLCRWDMRDARGRVQTIGNSDDSPVLHWSQGHQFSRGTNFQCFASTGDGSIVVGSVDGKIRLYSRSSMRMAKTVFPGLGSPITHVDVTYDGKWILGTTDTYLVLICTIFKDKDGKEKTGFSGRMGSRIAAPRLLKLSPLDSILAGNDNKFHGGQFSWVTENGKQEKHLVATVGKFSLIWNFQKVKDSNHHCYRDQEGLKSCYCYKVVLKEESIVDSRFMHENFAGSDSPEAPLVVATPMKVSSFSIASKR
ncbi:protein CYPRO4-like [Triticum urartu]|uniref:Vacuolar import/degradation Vid27 C-terminal domain-containing protein n=1 Tax=Triticum urartu TaxID=4572 RepID=A0A8R7QWE3_TRIUA|nr:protein CYPRO4-like [Triticum urartu]